MDDLIFNELSVKPYPADFNELNQRLKNLILLCKSVREQFGYKKLRFTKEFHDYQLLIDKFSFTDYINDKRVNPTIKTLLLDLRRYPFIEDNDESVLTEYCNNQFSFQKDSEKLRCDGLAAAYLYNTLATSCLSEDIWDDIKINISVHNNDVESKVSVFHISKIEHFQNQSALTQWLLGNVQQNIKTGADLKHLYPSYFFETQAIDDLFYWKEENKALYDRLHLLLKDVELNPFTGGLGKTESLKYEKGRASKRLTDEHRIIYSLKGNIITIHSCKGHYSD